MCNSSVNFAFGTSAFCLNFVEVRISAALETRPARALPLGQRRSARALQGTLTEAYFDHL